MKLDRNYGTGKYAIVKMRVLHALPPTIRKEADVALLYLASLGLIESPAPKSEEEFFVIRLRDQYAAVALDAYATAAATYDPEYAGEVQTLADRAGPRSPFCKRPD